MDIKQIVVAWFVVNIQVLLVLLYLVAGLSHSLTSCQALTVMSHNIII